MAKIRQITDAVWHEFQKQMAQAGMHESEYLSHLMSTSSGKEVDEALKIQAMDAINDMGKAQAALQKQKQKSKDLASTVNELTAKIIPLEEKLKDYESRFLMQEKELDELQQRINDQKIHIETQEETLRDAGDKIAELTQKLADKETELEDITLDEAEEILKDE